MVVVAKKAESTRRAAICNRLREARALIAHSRGDRRLRDCLSDAWDLLAEVRESLLAIGFDKSPIDCEFYSTLSPQETRRNVIVNSPTTEIVRIKYEVYKYQVEQLAADQPTLAPRNLPKFGESLPGSIQLTSGRIAFCLMTQIHTIGEYQQHQIVTALDQWIAAMENGLDAEDLEPLRSALPLLDQNERLALMALAKFYPKAVQQMAVVGYVRRGRRTIGPALTRLVERGFAELPHGPRSGYVLTGDGLKLVSVAT